MFVVFYFFLFMCLIVLEMDFDTSSETTQYAKLLKQVENLKIENTSLKKELNSNTSQINRLELEATTLKVKFQFKKICFSLA